MNFVGDRIDGYEEPCTLMTREAAETQFKNRMILRRAMMRHGFRPLDTEWWHFTLNDEPYPDTYFTFPVRRIP